MKLREHGVQLIRCLAILIQPLCVAFDARKRGDVIEKGAERFLLVKLE